MKKVIHPVHGTGTISQSLLEAASPKDSVLVNFSEGAVSVLKSELREQLNS